MIYAYYVVEGNGSKFTDLHRIGNHCYYYHRGIAEVFVWSTIYSSYWTG